MCLCVCCACVCARARVCVFSSRDTAVLLNLSCQITCPNILRFQHVGLLLHQHRPIHDCKLRPAYIMVTSFSSKMYACRPIRMCLLSNVCTCMCCFSGFPIQIVQMLSLGLLNLEINDETYDPNAPNSKVTVTLTLTKHTIKNNTNLSNFDLNFNVNW